METDVDSLLRAGVGTNRLENAGSPVHRLAPTRRDSVVRNTANVGSRRRASHGLSGWRNRHIRSNRGTVSAARPTHNGDARLARNLFARRTSSSAAPDPQEPPEVGRDTSRTVLDTIRQGFITRCPPTHQGARTRGLWRQTLRPL